MDYPYPVYADDYSSRPPRSTLPGKLLLVLLGAALMFGGMNYRPAINTTPLDPAGPHSSEEVANETADSYLVIVEETQARPIQRQKVWDDSDFWYGLKDRGLKGFRRLDPDSEDATQFENEATERGVSHPFVMHVAANGKVLSVIEFPESTSAIEAMIK